MSMIHLNVLEKIKIQKRKNRKFPTKDFQIIASLFIIYTPRLTYQLYFEFQQYREIDLPSEHSPVHRHL